MMAHAPRSLFSSILVAVLLCMSGESVAAQSALPQPPIQPAGQRVVEVRVLSETGNVLEQNPPDLPLAAGQEFTLDLERETLRQLYRSGRYADLTAEVAPVEGGLRVDFVAVRNFYVGTVHIEGLREPPSQSLALSSLRLTL